MKTGPVTPWRLSLISGLLVLAHVWILGCASAPAATSTPQPTPTASPREIIERSAKRMIALDTAEFSLTHEGDSSTVLIPTPLVVFNLVEGQVDMPDRYSIRVEGSVAFSEDLKGFIEIRVVSSGDQTFMTDFINRKKWNPVQPDVLPFNFADLGRTLGDIIDSLEDPRITGTEEVDGVESWRVRGNVPSEGLSSLIPTAEPGFEVGLDLWIGLEHNLLRKARIEGQVLSRDDPQVVRLLTLYNFDQPVDISLP